jgi:hypothetical protein
MPAETKNWTDQLPKETNSRFLKLIESMTGKSYFEAWALHDVVYLIRAAHHPNRPLCETCKGSGYQNLIGAPGCLGGCRDCAGTGLALPVLDVDSNNKAHVEKTLI